MGRTQTQTLTKTILAALTIFHDLDKLFPKTSTRCTLFFLSAYKFKIEMKSSFFWELDAGDGNWGLGIGD
jgi:hypothetical protein